MDDVKKKYGFRWRVWVTALHPLSCRPNEMLRCPLKQTGWLIKAVFAKNSRIRMVLPGIVDINNHNW